MSSREIARQMEKEPDEEEGDNLLERINLWLFGFKVQQREAYVYWGGLVLFLVTLLYSLLDTVVELGKYLG